MAAPLSLHQYLHYSQYQQPGEPGLYCPLVWDMRESPAGAARHVTSLETPLSGRQFSQTATYPPLVLLKITSDILPEPWTIEAANPVYVTLLDVLQAIYTNLHVPLEESEWARLPRKQQTRTHAAFERRCQLALDPSHCRAQGKLRIDCLANHVIFGGLSPSPETQSSCILSLRRPPP